MTYRKQCIGMARLGPLLKAGAWISSLGSLSPAR
jgi:hypothetical protein